MLETGLTNQAGDTDLPELTKRQMINILWAQLELERTRYFSQWQDLGDYILPDRKRFYLTDGDLGPPSRKKIIDTTGTLAARTCESGMMSGITNPARPWFHLTTPDPDLAKSSAVKEWLETVTERMNMVFQRSNFYNVMPTLYGDLATFATGAVLMEEDMETVVRYQSLPIGSFWIGLDYRGRVGVFARELRMTVRQLIQKFGKKDRHGRLDWSNFSMRIKSLYATGALQTQVDVRHVIYPNPDFDPRKLHSKFKRFASCYFEKGSQGDTNQSSGDDIYLREAGYDIFPVLAPRWKVTGWDAYGSECPGMFTLPDIKQLQLGEKRSLEAIEKMVRPPMIGPPELQKAGVNLLPGGITWHAEREGVKGFRSAYDIRFDISALEMKQDKVRGRVKEGYYVDFFLPIMALEDKGDRTAYEVAERKDEKLVGLGPVLQRVNEDCLDPNIDNVFEYMSRQGMIPPPPTELQGAPVRVEYDSILHQAMKLAGIGGMDRFGSFLGNVVQWTQDPSIADIVDKYKYVAAYADLTGIRPQLIRTQDDWNQIQANRAKQAQAQQQMERLQQATGAVKDLSQSDTSGGNALTDLIDQSNAGQVVRQQ